MSDTFSEAVRARLAIAGPNAAGLRRALFDAVTIAAWYVQDPFLKAIKKMGWAWQVVLTQEQSLRISLDCIRSKD